MGGVPLLAKKYSGAARSFLRGWLLFVPLALVNAASGSPGSNITWVDQWWMPVTLPWFSGIVEEVWFRLLLLSLCYFLLRPAPRRYPVLAAAAAVLSSSIVFGLWAMAERERDS